MILIFYYNHYDLENACTEVTDKNAPDQSNLSISQQVIFLEKIHGSLLFFSDFLVKRNIDQV